MRKLLDSLITALWGPQHSPSRCLVGTFYGGFMTGFHEQTVKMKNYVVVDIRKQHCGCPCRACKTHISRWAVPLIVEPLELENPN